MKIVWNKVLHIYRRESRNARSARGICFLLCCGSARPLYSSIDLLQQIGAVRAPIAHFHSLITLIWSFGAAHASREPIASFHSLITLIWLFGAAHASHAYGTFPFTNNIFGLGDKENHTLITMLNYNYKELYSPI